LRSLITGVRGFAGGHLADGLALTPQAEVWGCDRSDERLPFHPPQLQLTAIDLRDPAAVYALIETIRPEAIYHLAGQAFVGASWDDPWSTLELNLRAQLNILEATRRFCPHARVLVIGSNEEYGLLAPDTGPVDEATPLRPCNPYGVSKVAQDMLGLQYHLSHQLQVVRVRPFNHIGPRQNPQFVVPAFASQIAAIEAGRQPPIIRVGNLAARRDFTDVRDMMRAYMLALELGEAGEVYNIGTGQSRSIQAVLQALLALAAVPITIEIDPARLRPADVPDMVCDAAKFRARTGWAPRVDFEQTLLDVLNYERARIAAL